MIVIQANPKGNSSIVTSTIYFTGWELFSADASARFPKNALPIAGSFILVLTNQTTGGVTRVASGDIRVAGAIFTRRYIKFSVRATRSSLAYSSSLGGSCNLSGADAGPGFYTYQLYYQTNVTGNTDPTDSSAGVSNIIDEGLCFVKQDGTPFAVPQVTTYEPTIETYTYYIE